MFEHNLNLYIVIPLETHELDSSVLIGDVRQVGQSAIPASKLFIFNFKNKIVVIYLIIY